MNIQDKDLDQLFRSKLEGFEAEPGARVWSNISNELDEPKKRKSGMLWLRIAASILVLISAGLFFLPKEPIAIVKPKNTVTVNLSNQKPVVVPTVIVSPTITSPQINTMAHVKYVGKNSKTPQPSPVVQYAMVKQPTIKTSTQTITPDVVKITPAVNDQQQVLAAASNTSITKPVVPDVTTPLLNKTVDIQSITKPTAVLASVNEKDINAAPAKKHKIHGLGSFLNAVVAVVDKREDKIIEFTDTSEGNMVTGVNLGIVTIKKNQ